MTKHPERIWAWDDENCTSQNPHNKFTTEYIRADLVQALVEALRFGVDLIEGDSFGSEWKRGQADFRRKARTALAAFDKT